MRGKGKCQDTCHTLHKLKFHEDRNQSCIYWGLADSAQGTSLFFFFFCMACKLRMVSHFKWAHFKWAISPYIISLILPLASKAWNVSHLTLGEKVCQSPGLIIILTSKLNIMPDRHLVQLNICWIELPRIHSIDWGSMPWSMCPKLASD